MKNIFLTMSLGIGLLFPCKLHAQSQYPFQNTTLSTEERVDDLIKRMTLEEKIDLLSGYNDFYLHPCERLGIQTGRRSAGRCILGIIRTRHRISISTFAGCLLE